MVRRGCLFLQLIEADDLNRLHIMKLFQRRPDRTDIGADMVCNVLARQPAEFVGSLYFAIYAARPLTKLVVSLTRLVLFFVCISSEQVTERSCDLKKHQAYAPQHLRSQIYLTVAKRLIRSEQMGT